MRQITRLAPSPTGALHLGNARSFLINWLLARKYGWKILLRIEDLDGPRIKPLAAEQAIEDLRWLGLDWDEGPVYQSPRADIYRDLTAKLLREGAAYPCICTRREVDLAASAPHAEDGAAIYPGTCRGKFGSVDEARTEAGREPAIRFRVTDGEVNWFDEFRGPMRSDPAKELGDFVIQKGDGTAAYQLAVVADDAEAGVTHVVRGDDLIDSTPRQILLYRSLGWAARIPKYFHLPLVVGPDGRRLAKRHGDTRISEYRELGVPAERIRDLLFRWSGITTEFNLSSLPREPVVFTPADDQWLRAAASIR